MNHNEYLKQSIQTVKNMSINVHNFTLHEFKSIKQLIKIAELKLSENLNKPNENIKAPKYDKISEGPCL